MKKWYKSKSIQYAILSGLAIIVTAFASNYPEIAILGVANTLVQILLRALTTEPIA